MKLARPWSAEAMFLAQQLKTGGGHVTRIVGGAVRDLLRGETPADIDLVTTATPFEMMQIAERQGLNTIPTAQRLRDFPDDWNKGGLKHGTVTFVLNGEPFEITTLRADIATDGRHAEVAFVQDFRIDAARRDFTINAMNVDIHGRVHDYYGGIKDLQNREVRFVGEPEERIQEDYLRILRYFRMRAKLDDRSRNEVAFNAILRHADDLDGLAGERIWQEMKKLLASATGVSQLPFMQSTGVLAKLGIQMNEQTYSRASLAAENASGSAVVLGMLTSNDWTDLDAIVDRWRLSKSEGMIAKFIKEEAASTATDFDRFVAAICCENARADLPSLLYQAVGETALASALRAQLPKFPVTGEDLIALGVKPGPEMGELIKRLKAVWRASGYSLSSTELLQSLPDISAPPSRGFK
ncbi:CCA tRNA nucleotidyltransferase [Thalassospira xianhensis]|uniref:Poly(A) polymerase n=1 Tax=Thalassospira xianhensis MCCC 1A02616 TaxID=1177929 RepID=A0A367U8A9_9PROT|nr:CCA tRNA nucleotidyltransferase [Thalassospira xianhensis]RCK04150.1 hypothetical protein TH5_21480 [Thalassospira xianhensis MCCC 1A02616]